jgi:phage repressor protein C with HTH and peptisase S24 domain
MTSIPHLLREKHNSFVDRLSVLEELVGNKSKLATRAGLSNSGIRHYFFENGEPTRPQLIALARAAGVHIDWLVTGEGAMRPVSVETRTFIVETYFKYRQTGRFADNHETRVEFTRAYNNGVFARTPQIGALSVYELNRWLEEYAAPTLSGGEFINTPFHDLDDVSQEPTSASTDVSGRKETPLSFRRNLAIDKWKLDSGKLKLFAVASDDQHGPFRPHDWVLCDCRKAESPRNGIYLINTPDGQLFRRVQFLNSGRVRVIREPQPYSDGVDRSGDDAEEYDARQVKLIGRAFGYWRRIRM